MKKNALIIGVDSTIGRALQKELITAGWTVFGTTRRKEHLTNRVFYLDLSNVSAFNFSLPIDAVFLCGSVTKISSCRSNPDYSQIVNEDAQIQLAKYFLINSIHIVFLSTSAVFSGNKPGYRVDDLTCPITIYGKYKASVEEKLLGLSKFVSIVRLTKVLTPEYPLILQWLKDLSVGKRIEPFNDLNVSPISIKIVTQCLREVVEKKIFGIIHLSGERDVTYQKVAEHLVSMMKLNRLLIKPKSALLSGVVLEEAPLYTSLDMTGSKKFFVIPDISLIAILNNLYGETLCNAPSVHH